MEIVSFLRILARHRVAVTFGVVLAALAGAATYKLSSKSHDTAIAWGNMILAEPHTTPSALDSRISGSLADRATLLADLATTESARNAIAHAAGLPAADVAVQGPAMGAPQIPIPMPVAAQPVALPTALYTASVSTEDPATGSQVPIIHVMVTGPVLATEERVVTAVMKSMEGIVGSPIHAAGVSSLVAQPLGAPQVVVEAPSSHKVFAVLVPIVVLIMWCSAIVIGSGLARRARSRRGRTRGTRFGVRRRPKEA
jgi:hypothetical protein